MTGFLFAWYFNIKTIPLFLYYFNRFWFFQFVWFKYMNIFSLCNFLFYSYFLFYLFTYLSILSLLNFFSLESQYFAFTLVPPRPVVDRCHIMADLYRWRKYQIMKYPQSTRDDFQVINFIVFTISSPRLFFLSSLFYSFLSPYFFF